MQRQRQLDRDAGLAGGARLVEQPGQRFVQRRGAQEIVIAADLATGRGVDIDYRVGQIVDVCFRAIQLVAVDVGSRRIDGKTFALDAQMCTDVGQARPVMCERGSEEHTSELTSLMRTSFAVFCLKKK